MKEPSVQRPTFLGHKMRWVSSSMDGGSVYWGHCWKYQSPSGKLSVRAWPAQPNQNDEEIVDEPEVRLDFKLKMETAAIDTIFLGKYHTHKELLRLLERAEKNVKRLFRHVKSDYTRLKEVLDD